MNWVKMIIYWVTDLTRKVLPFNENEILKKIRNNSIKWWFTLLHLDEEKNDTIVFLTKRNEAKKPSKRSGALFTFPIISN